MHTSVEKIENLIEKIRVQDRETLLSIYKEVFPMVEKYIQRNSGTSTDAQDIFQDALYLLIKKTDDLSFELTAKLSTYLFGISKNLWLKELTKQKIDANELDQSEEEYEIIEEQEFQQLARVQKVKDSLSKLGEPCKTILEHYYFFKTSMKKIAEMLHYASPEHAKNQKYKCFIRLKKSLGLTSQLVKN